MKTHSTFLKIFSGLLIFSGCDRAEKVNTTTISFRAPDFTNSLTVSSGKLSGSAPVDKSELNCYGLLVSGPEDFLQKNRCYQSNSQAATSFPVGIFQAGIPAGQELSVEVPSGPDRVIRLIGFKAQSGYCYSWLGANSNPQNYVSPGYLLGTAGALQLEPGTTKEINIPVTFDNSKWFDDCDGPDFSNATNGGGGTPAGLAIKKPNYPAAYFVKTPSSTCQPYELTLINASGNPTSLPSGQSLTFNLSANRLDGGLNNLGSLNIYQDFTACTGGGGAGAINQITFTSSMNKMNLYARGISSGDSSTAKVKFIASNATLPENNLTLTTALYSAIGFDVTAPASFVAGGCYAVNVTRKDFSGSLANGNFSISLPSGGFSYASDCSSSFTSATSVSSATFYVMAPAGAAANSTFQFTISGPSAESKTVSTTIAAGTVTPTALRVLGYTSFPATSTCGPDSKIDVVLVNESNSIVPWRIAASNTITVDYPASYVTLATGDCPSPGPGVVFTDLSNYTVSRGEYSKSFFVKSLGSASTNLAITFSSSNATITVAPWNFQLNP